MYLEWIGHLCRLEWWHHPWVPLDFKVETTPSWVVMGTPGFLSQWSRERDPRLEMRKITGALLELRRVPRYSSQVEAVCWGASWAASRVSRTLLKLKRVGRISLEMTLKKKTSSRVEGRISWFFSRSIQSVPLLSRVRLLSTHESQHARAPCPSPTPRVHSDSRPWSQWCHPAISSSLSPFSYRPRSFPTSGSFPMSRLLTSGGQSIGIWIVIFKTFYSP